MHEWVRLWMQLATHIDRDIEKESEWHTQAGGNKSQKAIILNSLSCCSLHLLWQSSSPSTGICVCIACANQPATVQAWNDKTEVPTDTYNSTTFQHFNNTNQLQKVKAAPITWNDPFQVCAVHKSRKRKTTNNRRVADWTDREKRARQQQQQKKEQQKNDEESMH